MRIDVLQALIENSTLLVVAFLFLSRFPRWEFLDRPVLRNLTQGIVYAFCGILAIVFSVEVFPGILIDMRAPVVVVAALTGGPVVGIITVIPILVYRIFVGGTGMLPGLGIILSALVFGLLLRIAEKSRFCTSGILFQIVPGIGSAVIYFAWILTLPDAYSMVVLRETALALTIASVITILAIFFIRSRELAHQALLKNLTEINDLFEEISLDDNIGIIVLQESHIVYINQSLLSRYGFSKFDEDNVDLLDIVDEKTCLRVKKFLNLTFSGSPREAVPIEIRLKNGRALNLLVHARKLLYRRKESLLVVSVDVSKLVEAEKALQNRFDQLQLALDTSGAVLWKAELFEDRLIANEEFFNLLSYTPPEDQPLFSHFLLETTFNEEMRKSMDSLCKGKIDSIFGEMSFAGDDFVTRWFNIGARTTGIGLDGKPQQITGILFDTTVIKEKELTTMQSEIDDIQSQKMEAIGRLAGGVAHDFNNLLHVIIGYTDILNRVSNNDSVIRDISDPILKAAQRGKELVSQLLLFSREKKPELESVNLNEIVLNFSKMLSRIMEEYIVISTEIYVENALIFGDIGQIDQVLMNLCVNARDAMKYGGNIVIGLDEIHLNLPLKVTTGTLKQGNYLILSVKDTGPGIAESEHPNIFEPFFTTKRIDEGTGLGLATVLGIVREHSGFIDVTNRIEKGLEIKVYFPKLKTECHSFILPKKLNVVPLVEDPSYIRSICILLAEDDPQVMNLAIEGLGAATIRVLRASNGREAIEVFKKNRDDIEMLVFDVIMPEMNGPDAYREILSIGGDIPVVFTTGYAGDRLTGIEGTHEVINKPYAMDDLVAVIRRMTNQETGE
ncbi:MAG: response regulator [Candidatus Sabulitectum sp.]|nr:response regulator [Candidatus Sabulitectum sp.]